MFLNRQTPEVSEVQSATHHHLEAMQVSNHISAVNPIPTLNFPHDIKFRVDTVRYKKRDDAESEHQRSQIEWHDPEKATHIEVPGCTLCPTRPQEDIRNKQAG